LKLLLTQRLQFLTPLPKLQFKLPSPSQRPSLRWPYNPLLLQFPAFPQIPHKSPYTSKTLSHTCDEMRFTIQNADVFHVHQSQPFFFLQQRLMPSAGYMRRQRDINENMRTILVDWLNEVTQEYRLTTQTLHLAVNYTDRFLNQMNVERGKLQLVGVTALFLAAKFEEIFPPSVQDFVYITDNTYTRDQV
jgi:hypothetical protein